MMREIVLDTETTGLDPDHGHRIIEIGCVEMVNGFRTGEVFHCYLNPKRLVPKEAQAVHGITDEFLADKPTFDKVAEEFMVFVGSAQLVIHNAKFDMKFLNAELGFLKRKALSNAVIDTLEIAKKKFPGAKANLDALCQRFNIDRAHRKKHGALLDAELLAEVYSALMGRMNTLISFDVPAVKSRSGNNNKSENTISFKGQNLIARPHVASAEELQAHEDFLKKIKEPLWTNN